MIFPNASLGVEYRLIEGHPGYCVGNDGTVWSRKNGRYGFKSTWRLQKPKTEESGHLRITFDSTHQFHVHRLVLCAFVGPQPEGRESCHRDGDPSNNSASNLYWGTRLDNVKDAIKHGVLGGNRHVAISEEVAAAIRSKYVPRRYTRAALAAEFGLSFDAIKRILSNNYQLNNGYLSKC